jgi:MFS family permease
MLGYIVLLFSLPNYANSIGLTAQQGAIVGAVLNLGQGLGRPPIGYFSDSLGRINMAGFMTFLSGLFSLVIWVNAKSFGVGSISCFLLSRAELTEALGPRLLCTTWWHSSGHILANGRTRHRRNCGYLAIASCTLDHLAQSRPTHHILRAYSP